MTDGKTELYKKLYNHPSSDKTHDEILDELEERFNHPELNIMREKTYKRFDGSDKGEVDLIVSGEDLTVFYEVKSSCSFSDCKKAIDQLERQYETFDEQTENVDYIAKLDGKTLEYRGDEFVEEHP